MNNNKKKCPNCYETNENNNYEGYCNECLEILFEECDATESDIY